jgi:hypothetical protein
MKKHFLLLVGLILTLSLVGCGGGSTSSTPIQSPTSPSSPGTQVTLNPQAAKTGQWTTIATRMPVNPIHAALLHTGKILVLSGSGNCPPQQAGCPQSAPYAQGAALFDLSNQSARVLPTTWDMFCNGMSIMQDGRALINGGTKTYGQLAVVGTQGDTPFLGLPNTSIFDPSSESFVDVSPTAHGRWYPTMTELNDGRMMTTGGLDDTDGNTNNTSEIWNGQQWSTEIAGNPGIANFPGFQFPLYPRMHLLPTGHVFYSAPSSAT